MVVALLVAFVLDNTVPGTRQERGVYIWSNSKDIDTDPAALELYRLPKGVGRFFAWAKCVGSWYLVDKMCCSCCCIPGIKWTVKLYSFLMGLLLEIYDSLILFFPFHFWAVKKEQSLGWYYTEVSAPFDGGAWRREAFDEVLKVDTGIDHGISISADKNTYSRDNIREDLYVCWSLLPIDEWRLRDVE